MEHETYLQLVVACIRSTETPHFVRPQPSALSPVPCPPAASAKQNVPVPTSAANSEGTKLFYAAASLGVNAIFRLGKRITNKGPFFIGEAPSKFT